MTKTAAPPAELHALPGPRLTIWGKHACSACHTLAAGAIGTLLVVGSGCHGSGARQSTESSIVAQEIPAVERAVGVRFKHPPRVETRTPAQLRQFLRAQLADSQTQRDIAGSGTAYKLLGMIPDTLDLRSLMLRLLAEQVIGFYDPGTKVLYVVNGAPPAQLRITVTHELVHALQDQYVNLDSIQKSVGDDDRKMAAQAVFEGQATYEQLEVMLGPGNVAVSLPGGWDRVRQMIRNNREAMPVYSSAPLVIQESLIFPYLSGAEFMRVFKEQRPSGEPWDPLPVSTEQILHPPKYFATPPDLPLAVSVGTHGVKPSYDNDMGEFETRLYLYQLLGDQGDATRGAEGWGGDRYVVWGSGAISGMAWATAWDTPSDAADFYALVQRGAHPHRDAAHARRRTVTTGVVDGYPVVLIVNTPAGAPVPVSLADIRVAAPR